MIRWPWIVVLTLSASLLGGCSNDMSDLERDIAAIKARKSTRIPPIPQPKQFESFAYEADGRRDPFVAERPNVQITAPTRSGPRPNLDRNREALEEFPLDALRMAGTLTTPAGTFALIKAPDNIIHRVTLGDYLGQNYGRIVAINATEVSLLELIEDGLGGWTQRNASLALNP